MAARRPLPPVSTFFYVLWAAIFVGSGISLYAQDEQEADKMPLDESEQLPFFKRRAQKKKQAIAEGKWWFSPFVGPAYTPDFGGMIAAGALISFSGDRKDSTLQRSTIPVTFVASTEGNISLVSKMTTFWAEDKFRFNATVLYAKVIDQYYGVGYDLNSTIPKGENTTQFTRFTTKINPLFLARTWSGLYFGVGVDLNWNLSQDVNPLMAQDENFLKFGDQYFNSGLGLSAQYDTRDVAVNAYSGTYLELTSYFYGSYLGGDFDYQILSVDIRKYWRIKRDGRTLAARFGARTGFGDVPYTELSRVGGSENLRGYLKNQFRDQRVATLITEYRHMFLRKNKEELSRHGVTTWIGAGVMDGDDTNASPILPTIGVGYRFQIQPRMNVRVDFGVGNDTRGFYFSFNEAF